MPRPHDTQEAIRDVRVVEGMLSEAKRENEHGDRTAALRVDLRRSRLHAAAALLRRNRRPGGPSYEIAELLDAEAEFDKTEDDSPLEKTTVELDAWNDEDFGGEGSDEEE
jgi:hypothetical protein